MWYYEQQGSQQGPVDETVARRLIAEGVIGRRTLVWREGMIDWQPAEGSDLGRMFPAQGKTQPGTPAKPINPYAPPRTIAPRRVAAKPSAPMTWGRILFGFEGRIARRHYWAGSLIWIGILIGAVFGGAMVAEALDFPDAIMFLMIPMCILYMWSAIALQVKRWHDRDKPGVMVLINLIPYVGGIWAFIECGCMRGTMGPNSYGNDPT